MEEVGYYPSEIYLPVDSQPPLMGALHSDAALSGLLWQLHEARRNFKHFVTLAQFTGCLSELYNATTHAKTLFEHEITRLNEQHTYTSSAAVVRTLLPDLPEETITGFTIYDRYFKVIRVASLSFAQFVSQVLATAAALLRDLPNSILERTEIAALLHALELMLEGVLPQSGVASGANDFPNQPTILRPAKQSEAYARSVAMYRWVVGHQFFDLCSIFCRGYLDKSFSSIQAGNETEASAHLNKATIFLRGTTAAMWYAGNFSAELYQSYIRPSMVSTQTPNGFSGEQNADYVRLKLAKNQLKSSVTGQNLPNLVRTSLKNFREVYIQDNEQHTLIAASKVGSDFSLAQKDSQAELPPDMRLPTAVEVLRHMTELRSREAFL